MKLLFVARRMEDTAGGLQRMIIAIMNALARRGHSVSLFSWDRANAAAFYQLEDGISWHRLDMGDPHKKARPLARLQRVGVIRRLVRNAAPDVIVCFQGGPFVAMRLYTAGMGIPVVASERTAPTLYDHTSKGRLRDIEHQLFRTASLVTIQFDRYRSLYPAYLQNKLVTISNPVSPAATKAAPAGPGPGGKYRLLSVGRLHYQKNYEVLLDAFARVAPHFPDWELRIVGEGGSRPILEQQISATPALAGRVFLPGKTDRIATEYVAAHLFCLPSRWEGFPNALAEAMAHGLPVVGFEGCAGVPDLVIEGESGTLAAGNGDAESLASVLGRLMGDASKRAAMGANAAAAVARYSPDQIYNQWEKALQGCIRDNLSEPCEGPGRSS